jgi:WD40 repeat protein
VFPGYEVVDRLGAGGMGVVYRARQLALNRVVALKVIRAGVHASAEERKRFAAEAEAIARLQHPNIVQVHEVGDCADLPFFSLEFVEGGSLAQRLDGTPQAPRQAAALVRALAGAMQAAHDKGVVHRDLKPANVLLTADGTPKVSDFGLARLLDSDGGQTQTGARFGTPSYMAPEQAVGQAREAGPAADVYALGAILYELLTGRPPFRAATAMDTMHQVVTADPVPPSRLTAKVPRDLETICLKCLHKQPARRYASAADLADDLGRFLGGEPIRARRTGATERALKWARRRPAVALLLGVLAAVVAGGLAGMAVLYLRAEDERGNAVRRGEEALQRYQESRRLLYTSRMALARNAWRDGHESLARELLDELKPREADPDLRGFEWHYLQRLAGAELLSVTAGQEPALSADGRHCAVVFRDGGARLWDLHAPGSGPVEVPLAVESYPWQPAVVSADGRRLAITAAVVIVRQSRWERVPRVWDLKTGAPVNCALEASRPTCLAFSPDGSQLACGHTRLGPNKLTEVGGEVILCDASSGKAGRVLRGHAGRVVCLAYSPDGRRLASGSVDGTVKMWDLETGSAVWTTASGLPTAALAFSPAGDVLATAWALLDTDDPATPLASSALVREQVALWDARTGTAAGAVSGRAHDGWVASMAFAPDGRLITGGGSRRFGELKVWERVGKDEKTRLEPIASLEGHAALVRRVAVSGDGTRLVTADREGLVRVWDLARSLPGRALAPVGGAAAFAHDGGGAAWDFDVSVFGPDGRQRRRLLGSLAPANRVEVRGDGRLVATTADDGLVRVWAGDTGEPLRCLAAEAPRGSRCLAFHPDGRRLACAAPGNALRVWDLETGAAVTLGGQASPPSALVFTAGGEALAAYEDGLVLLWDVSAGRAVRSWHVENAVTELAADRDGTRLAAGGRDGSVWLWDAARDDAPATLKGHTGAITSLAVQAGGQRVASGSKDRTIKVWDPVAGQELLSLSGHRGAVVALAFSPRGGRLLSAAAGDTVVAWDAFPEEPGPEGPAGPTLNLPAEVTADARRQARALKNLSDITLALINAADARDSVLPANLTDKERKPLLSWRVVLLPYLGHEDLYREFKLDEAWDGPHNRKLLDRMPDVYARDPGGGESSTAFAVFTGPDALFHDGRLPRWPAAITDGTSFTILVAPAATPVPWTKPEDLPYDASRPLPSLAWLAPGGTYVGLADGSVHFLRKGTKEKTIRAAITPAGGEVIGPDW